MRRRLPKTKKIGTFLIVRTLALNDRPVLFQAWIFRTSRYRQAESRHCRRNCKLPNGANSHDKYAGSHSGAGQSGINGLLVTPTLHPDSGKDNYSALILSRSSLRHCLDAALHVVAPHDSLAGNALKYLRVFHSSDIGLRFWFSDFPPHSKRAAADTAGAHYCTPAATPYAAPKRLSDSAPFPQIRTRRSG